MTTKPLPAHGTTARAYGSPGYRQPCKCAPCSEARRRHHKRTRVNRQLGRSPFTSPELAQAKLRELHKTMSWKTLVAVTGLEINALLRIYNGQRTKIRNETHAKIMAVQAPAQGDQGQYLDATGSIRRVQALVCIGHSYAAIAQAASTSSNRILSLANIRQATIRRGLAQRINDAYERLAHTPAVVNKHTNRSRNFARSNGWRDPQWWEDYGHIDDPNFDPSNADRVLNFHERAKLRREEIIHLAWVGHEPEEILARLNGEVSISTVRQTVQEWRTGQRRQRKQVAA